MSNTKKTAVPVRTKVRAGGLMLSNHNQTAVPVRTKVRAGIRVGNHNLTVVRMAK